MVRCVWSTRDTLRSALAHVSDAGAHVLEGLGGSRLMRTRPPDGIGTVAGCWNPASSKLTILIIKSPSMGHGKYVGRVGALAVALGVGAAILTLPAVAAASPDEESTSSASPADDASTGPSAESDPGAADSPNSDADQPDTRNAAGCRRRRRVTGEPVR